MAGMYPSCPNCGTTDDWLVYRCENHHLYCTGCSDSGGGFLGIGASHDLCPRCGAACEKVVGKIYADEDEGDEDD